MKTPSLRSTDVSRRDFVRSAVLTAAVAPLIVPSRLLGAGAPSGRIRVGCIGAGRIAQSHDMPGVVNSKLADVVAVCDLDSRRAASGKASIEGMFKRNELPVPTIDLYGDYREMLARKDIDAVTISTPDHQHAEPALAAILAGKDVYLQKPFTMTHEEGALLKAACGKSDRIFQLGSQQRSWGPNEQFRKACEFVRSGRVGRLRSVEIGLPTDPTAPDNPEQPVPPHLNYEMWLGPTPQVYYTEQRVHSQGKDRKTGGPDVGSRPGWLRNDAYCLGMITGWGAHHFDVAHWGMDQELGGPSKLEGKGEFPTNKIWNVHGAYYVESLYPGGVKLTVSDKFPNGIRFVGDEGWIFVSRDASQQSKSSDPAMPKTLKSLDASKPSLLEPSEKLAVQFPHSTSHHKYWLERVKDRRPSLVPATIAHAANTACIVNWIAMKAARPLMWDVKAERFVGDAAANAMLSRPERGKWGAVQLAKSKGIKVAKA
ncbi:MAG: Gfo/Idh/MocA family oxidoreductase [Verrucomicrobia bacterium]|nr:Gfo/Idh/MocA family oxidoreductase [Verrucomicrobiota bacterium]